MDIKRLRRVVSDDNEYIWIGLKRNLTDKEKWIWSGGGEVSNFFWANNEPSNQAGEDYGLMHNFTWHDATDNKQKAFICYNPVVVWERKTWEEALKYCREHHSDLASVVSDTEMSLIQRKLRNYYTTDQFWIGLHFFPGNWHWVDRLPLRYEAWGQGGKPACPVLKQCAALQVMGNNNTNAMLTSNTAGGVSTSIVNIAPQISMNIYVESDSAVRGTDSVWEAHRCEERLPFICY
ncbi:hypothetical protein L3Q82_000819 [Scortum barcoo]|uniref:Uncharacterized protein n=1 Tax=Scortum barcoo TaxID=214431 RepID=A0ACB8WEY5_9TELE|nr:hypothetical protein L3Q82_000819 [Scortum barcoo]